MDIIVNGCAGRMGQLIAGRIEAGQGGHRLAAGVDVAYASRLVPKRYASLPEFTGAADAVIDFSHHAAAKALTEYCVGRKLPLVVATTGQTQEEKELIYAAAETIPVFFSANMSLGVAVLARLCAQAACMFPDADIEIIERHHNQKLDVPSGTALLLFDAIRQARPEAQAVVGRHENGKREKKEIGVHSLRLGGEIGTHEIIISTGSETMTLKHEAESRALFADGDLAAAEFLKDRPAGLYAMADLVKGEGT